MTPSKRSQLLLLSQWASLAKQLWEMRSELDHHHAAIQATAQRLTSLRQDLQSHSPPQTMKAADARHSALWVQSMRRQLACLELDHRGLTTKRARIEQQLALLGEDSIRILRALRRSRSIQHRAHRAHTERQMRASDFSDSAAHLATHRSSPGDLTLLPVPNLR